MYCIHTEEVMNVLVNSLLWTAVEKERQNIDKWGKKINKKWQHEG